MGHVTCRSASVFSVHHPGSDGLVTVGPMFPVANVVLTGVTVGVSGARLVHEL